MAARQLVDVPGQATADGTRVGLYQPTSGSNQRWAVRDETVLRSEVVSAYTIPGLVPDLPETVTAVLAGGGRATLPVTWRLPPERRWAKPGTVTVRGTATDVPGRHGGRAELPVTWDAAPPGAFDTIGVVTLTGTATVVGGTTVPAPVRVRVTEAVEGGAEIEVLAKEAGSGSASSGTG